MERVLWEYVTTHGEAGILVGGSFHAAPSAPKKPRGIGWEMCGMAADEGLLYWAWKRRVPSLKEIEKRRARCCFRVS